MFGPKVWGDFGCSPPESVMGIFRGTDGGPFPTAAIVAVELKGAVGQTRPLCSHGIVSMMGKHSRRESIQRNTSASSRRLAARKMSAKRWDEEIRTRTRRARWTTRAAT